MQAIAKRPLEQKRVSVSSKRQFTIPQKFFTELGFDKEAICTVQDGKLIVTPASNISGGEFAELILADLISDGYSGSDLLEEFKIRQAKVRSSVENILEGAHAAAQGTSEYSSYDEIFGTED